MPKIIRDVERIILEEAAMIFSEKGFNSTDMKAIASACGIAVGTLYNYYPNKKMLYQDVFLKSWNLTIKKLGTVSRDIAKRDQLEKQIEIFYKEMENRNGLGNDFRGLCKKGDEKFDLIAKNVMLEIIDATLKRFELKDEFKSIKGMQVRVIVIWITNQFELISDFPLEKEVNISILYNVVSNFFNLD